LWPQLLQTIAAADKQQPQVVRGGEGDTLQQALQALTTAVEQEGYEEAAQLRDASLNWLAGWWRPAVSAFTRNAATSSSLLHVQHSEPHRWTATLFTPVDFLNHDLSQNCVLRELDMSELLASPRYGTPLFEAHCVKGAADGSYALVVVALQSCNRAFSELLRVQEVGSRGRVATDPGAPRFTHQRLLLLLQPDRASVAAVHAGQHSTLWTWSSQLSVASAAASSSIHGPHRPAERSGALRVGLTVDGNHLELLRGPGSILRTAPDAVTFSRHALPAGVLGSLCSDGSDDASNWNQFGAAGSAARLFRVDLQYQLPPDEQPLAESEVGEASVSSSSSSSTPGQAARPTAAAWADRLAADVRQVLSQQQQAWASSCPQDQLQATLGALLAAAAAGTSPPGAVVSELQVAARITEVPLPGGEDAAAAADSGEGSGAGSGSAPVCGFTKVEGDSVTVGFGGFEMTG
jgi:hypothetical protein